MMGIFNRLTGDIRKMHVIQKPLPHNFQIVQVGPGPKVFLIGGGAWDNKAESPPEMYFCK